MKIIFLFDQVDAEGKLVAADSAPFVTTPDKLNLRQIAPGLSSIGIVFEQTNEQGETQQFFRQIVNFPISLVPQFASLEEEINYLKQLLTQRITQHVEASAQAAAQVEASAQAAAQASAPQTPAAPQETAPAAPPAVAEAPAPKAKRAKKSTSAPVANTEPTGAL